MLTHPDTVYIDEGVDFLDIGRYATATAPFGLATMLPRRAYTSEVFQRLEDEKIWTRDWVCIGTTAEIPGAFDLLPYTIGHHAIHVQRQPDGSLIGRFNKAQHGGCRTIPAQCRTGKKTKCSYTSCGYSRDREVIGGESLMEMSPQMGQFLGAVPERLLPVRIKTCGPLIFANVDPTLETEWHAAEPVWDGEFTRVDGNWREHRANWKIAGAALVDAARNPHCGGGAVNHVSAQWLFPNLVLIRSRSAALSIVLQPTAMDQTLWRMSFFVRSDFETSMHQAVLKQFAPLLKHAEAEALARQSTVETALASDPPEQSRAGWDFNQTLVERISRQHAAYWNAPLMRA
ncbi:hypothetical protein [Rhodopseudomonas palustris]|uniref:Rieske domain-containing protein n=1 Tax=Rhodopseudomonas palustris TaxID=1076 RepID=A0A418VJN4_RHOPL|nr:hypothetical protein [Rhodopseudomonas palustris]RJF76344.1 hypothetical protein D4Q52_06955 [Rhodopseudomonas palustris]